MTAIFMARLPDAIIASADAAFYDNQGRLTHATSKLILIPEYDTVITFQGPFFYHYELKGHLPSLVSSFDELLAVLPTLCQKIHDAHANAYGFSRAFAMLVGGYSLSREAWETYWLNSEPYEEGGSREPYEAWTLTRARATEWTPGYGPDEAVKAGIDPYVPLNKQGMDASEVAIRTIVACRCVSIPIGGDERNGACQVGGFIQFARIERGSITTLIVHRWPDLIGDRLDPANGDLLPGYLHADAGNDDALRSTVEEAR